MSVKNFRNAMIVIGLIFLLSSLSSATWATQEPARTPTPEEVRKQMLERLVKQAQESQKNPGQTPGPASSAPPAPAPRPTSAIPSVAASASQGGKVQINYENADLYDFISEISNMLGLTPLVVDSEVKGNVNIISTGPMSKEDVLPLFNMILKNNNAALVKQGDVYQIVPISSALKRGVEVLELPTGIPGQPSDVKISTDGKIETAKPQTVPKTPDMQNPKVPRLVTHVIRVEFVPVKDLIEPIKMFMTEGGVIMPYERLNMLIITDYTDSAARVLDIIRMLDNSYLDPNLVDLIKIKNNASADVAEDLKKIFGSGTKDSATGISFVSLDRLNAIFVLATSKRGLEEIRHWISQLDAESGRNIQTYVYVVENSTASQIAMMLAALYGGEELSSSTSGTTGTDTGSGAIGGSRSSQMGSMGSSTTSRGRTSTMGSSGNLSSQSYNQGNQVYNPGVGSGSGFWNNGIFGGNQRLGPQLNVSRSITSQILRGGEFTGLQDTVRLVVDDVNNSIIIQSTAADYAYILETIKKMDVLPRQAIIDARIYEVDLNDDLRFGVNYYLQARGDTSKGTTMTLGSLQSGLLSASTFAFVGDSRQLIMNLEALRNKTKVKVLEAPSILALDGMQASINVGAEYPYPGGSYISSVGGSASDIQYRETGVTLLVLPRISASGSVTMDITQEVSSAGASVSVGTNESAPTFPKALVTTTCYVKDGETVAIAGLIRDSNSTGRRGIPLLSDIPIFGSLFGVTTRGANRTELIVLITPRVLRSHDDLKDMTQELKDSLRNVRKLVDDTDKLKAQDLEDAAKDREKQEPKPQDKSNSSQPGK
jgi:general secretion pathway protein D